MSNACGAESSEMQALLNFCDIYYRMILLQVEEILM